MMMLKIDNLSVYYGKIKAIENINLTVANKEIVGIIGSNGAGKSTIINSIIGFIKPKEGKIIYNGNDISKFPTNLRIKMGLAIVPEGRRIFPYLTVEENLLYGAIGNWHERKDKLEFVYTIFPRLKERRNQPAYTLSGGEQQMLVIGRALMSKPKLLLIDEPTLGLAPKLVVEVYTIIRQLRDNYNITILIADQNANMVLTTADRAYVLENGKIVLEGEARDLINNPKVASAYLGL